MNQWLYPIWPNHAGNKSDTAKADECEQNIFHSKLADLVGQGGRLPNTSKINAAAKEYAKNRAI
jgi:hypothetical protein